MLQIVWGTTMSDLLPIGIAAVFVMAIVLLLARKFKISSRYERAPRQLNSWSALDKGIDPTVDQKQ
jgi:ABC-type Fe3+-siderophore transport system permease subunit